MRDMLRDWRVWWSIFFAIMLAIHLWNSHSAMRDCTDTGRTEASCLALMNP